MNTTTMLGCAMALATASCTYETIYYTEANEPGVEHAAPVTSATTTAPATTDEADAGTDASDTAMGPCNPGEVGSCPAGSWCPTPNDVLGPVVAPGTCAPCVATADYCDDTTMMVTAVCTTDWCELNGPSTTCIDLGAAVQTPCH